MIKYLLGMLYIIGYFLVFVLIRFFCLLTFFFPFRALSMVKLEICTIAAATHQFPRAFFFKRRLLLEERRN